METCDNDTSMVFSIHEWNKWHIISHSTNRGLDLKVIQLEVITKSDIHPEIKKGLSNATNVILVYDTLKISCHSSKRVGDDPSGGFPLFAS